MDKRGTWEAPLFFCGLPHILLAGAVGVRRWFFPCCLGFLILMIGRASWPGLPESPKAVSGDNRAVITAAAPAPRVTTAGHLISRPAYQLASFTTSFDPQAAGRTANIARAAAALDGQLVPPGEVFSFNRAVGPRTDKAGYVAALVIENREYVVGIGGGVCQVSSTLYNAVLRAGLPVIERHHHSLAVGYVPPGLDATVAYDSLDLRFLNNTDGFLRMASSVGTDRVTLAVYGERLPGPEVQVTAKVEEVLEAPVTYRRDPRLPAGKKFLEQEGLPGYRITVVRVVGEGGKARSEVISSDTYLPLPAIWRVGSGPVRP